MSNNEKINIHPLCVIFHQTVFQYGYLFFISIIVSAIKGTGSQNKMCRKNCSIFLFSFLTKSRHHLHKKKYNKQKNIYSFNLKLWTIFVILGCRWRNNTPSYLSVIHIYVLLLFRLFRRVEVS